MKSQADACIIAPMIRLALLSLVLTLLAALHAQAQSPVLALEQPSPERPQQAGLLRAPIFDRSEPALAYFKLENNWKDDAAEDYLTFGQAFPAGVLRREDTIAARYGDVTLPAQIDIKAHHDDGSVRHGVITIATPAIKSGKRIGGALIANAAPSAALSSGAFDATDYLAETFAAPIGLTFYFADGSEEIVDIDTRGAVLDAAGRADRDEWLNGALTKEFRVEIPAAPHVTVRLDIRAYRDGDVRMSAGFMNDKSFGSGRRDSVYDVTIGETFTAEKVPHHRAANWRRVFWIGDQPRLHIIHDIEALTAANVIAPVDASPGVDAALIAERDAVLRALPPLSPALIERYMPATGGRPDIGLYPQWTSHYLAAQTEASKRVMLANADAAGAVPWHFADDASGAPISIEQYPKFWADERGLEAQYVPDRPHPDIFASSDGGWSPDHSHKPALTAVPYLVTGDRYYADELAMQAAWAIFGRWPALREGGTKAIDVEQVRASAWSLRDLSDAAFLLPDAHPSQKYLNRALENNLRLAKEKYIDNQAMNAAGELEGYFEELIDREPERISPWQNDYMALSLWLAARRGDENADALLVWSANFHAGRFLYRDFPLLWGASYRLPVKDAQTQEPASSWAALAAKIRARGPQPEDIESYPELANGYAGSAYAALTAITSQVASPSAFEALAVLMRETKHYNMWTQRAEGGVYRNNNFLFELTAPNGAQYTRRHIAWNTKPKDAGGLVIGRVGDERLNGGKSHDAIFGLDGNDVINAGPGDDYLNGGPGKNTLSGGAGADIFAFSRMDDSVDRITDFNSAEDVIHIDFPITNNSFESAVIVTDTKEGARIAFANGRAIAILEDVSAAMLSDKNIIKFE